MHAAPFTLALNTSTIRCGGAPLETLIEATARAGFSGIEPWVGEIDAWTASGRTFAALRRRLDDAGLRVVNLIGFFEWAVDDGALRAAGLTEASRALDLANALGAPFIAAPPLGIDRVQVDLRQVSARFSELMALAHARGPARPLVEYWGHARTLGTAGEVLQVAADCGDREARVLADVFHTYKSTGRFEAFRLCGAETLGLFHLNDYPAMPARAAVTDSDRVYPGDGCAPLAAILRDLAAGGYRGALSVELFNSDYWTRPPAEVARTAFEKTNAVLATAFPSAQTSLSHS